MHTYVKYSHYYKEKRIVFFILYSLTFSQCQIFVECCFARNKLFFSWCVCGVVLLLFFALMPSQTNNVSCFYLQKAKYLYFCCDVIHTQRVFFCFVLILCFYLFIVRGSFLAMRRMNFCFCTKKYICKWVSACITSDVYTANTNTNVITC